VTITDDILVLADPDGKHYVGLVGDSGQWFKWPAEAHGWRARTRVEPSYAERCREVEHPFSMLAVRLSGVE
jgi:hypothetical protein